MNEGRFKTPFLKLMIWEAEWFVAVVAADRYLKVAARWILDMWLIYQDHEKSYHGYALRPEVFNMAIGRHMV